MSIREVIHEAGLGEHFVDFFDLVELFGVLEEKHGGKRLDSTVLCQRKWHFSGLHWSG